MPGPPSDIYFAFPADALAKAATAARYSAAARKDGLLGEEAEAQAAGAHEAAWVPQHKAWAELEESGLAYENTVPVLIVLVSHRQCGTGIYSGAVTCFTSCDPDCGTPS